MRNIPRKLIDHNYDEEYNNDLVAVKPREYDTPELFGAEASEIPVFEDVFAGDLIPKGDWMDHINADPDQCLTYLNRVNQRNGFRHQGNSHFCVANGTCGGMECLMEAADYLDGGVPSLSCVSLYQRATNMRQWGGSSLSANVRFAMGEGALPARNDENDARFKHTWNWNTWEGKKLPQGYKNTAKYFRLKEVYEVKGEVGMVSAVLKGHPVLYARRGHCILGVAVVYDEDRRQFLWKYLDSYGALGNDGCRYDSMGTADRASYGAYAFAAVEIVKLPEPGQKQSSKAKGGSRAKKKAA